MEKRAELGEFVALSGMDQCLRKSVIEVEEHSLKGFAMVCVK